MILARSNTHCAVAVATDKEARWIYNYLSFPDDKARFRRSRWGDGKVHMMSATTQLFPAGFLGAVLKQAAADKINVQVKDERKRPIKADAQALIDWLRDYQHEAVQEAKLTPAGVFHHVTGAGKTEVMVALGEVFPCRWLILTHRKDLLIQTVERFARRTGEEVGMVGEGVFAPKRITVATFQTISIGLQQRKKHIAQLLLDAEGLMVDECHVVPANSFYRVCMAAKNAYYRYGFSGTPFARGDRKSIYTWGALGPIIHRIPAERLIKAGVLAKPTIKMVTTKHKPLATKTWAEAYAQGITGSTIRNQKVVKAAKLAEKPCLLFVKELAHGKLLESALRRAGTKVEFVWGQHNTAVRKSAIRRLVHGDTDVLICSVIFQEGIDIPELQSVVIASGGKSVIAALQDVGRGMRRHSRDGKVTKEEFEVYDFKDDGCGCHGSVKHRGCGWLEKHTRGRLKAYASERYRVVEVQL